MRRTRTQTTNADPPGRMLALLACGYLLFGVGLIGTMLPVLPTTVFWIAAASCFAKSSPAMYRRILAWPRVGTAIADFITHGVIRRGSKALAVSGMAMAAGVVALAPMGAVPTLVSWAGIALAAAYVLSCRERAKAPSEPDRGRTQSPPAIRRSHESGLSY